MKNSILNTFSINAQMLQLNNNKKLLKLYSITVIHVYINHIICVLHWIQALHTGSPLTQCSHDWDSSPLVSALCAAVQNVSLANKLSMWHGSNESRCFVLLLAHKHYIEHLSNSCYCFIKGIYIAIIIVIVFRPALNLSHSHQSLCILHPDLWV